MSGHGWVTPNADGSVARCGGPAICAQCAGEQVAKDLADAQAVERRDNTMHIAGVLTERKRIVKLLRAEMEAAGASHTYITLLAIMEKLERGE